MVTVPNSDDVLDILHYKKRSLERYDDIYEKAIDKGDLRVALKAQEQLENLIGLTKQENTPSGIRIIIERASANQQVDGD